MSKEISCPCYEGDGYIYEFDNLEFNFCEVCHKKLFKKMVEQYKLEKECGDAFEKKFGIPINKQDAKCTTSESEDKDGN